MDWVIHKNVVDPNPIQLGKLLRIRYPSNHPYVPKRGKEKNIQQSHQNNSFHETNNSKIIPGSGGTELNS